MSLQRGIRVFATQWQAVRQPSHLTRSTATLIPRRRWLHASRQLQAVKPVLLADIGEGIVECEIIQWFVEPGARVEEFSPLCEVQSDKASVEITSRFAGIVKKLYYDAGEMARVGKPFVDIDIAGDAGGAIEAPASTTAGDQSRQEQSKSLSEESEESPKVNTLKEQSKPGGPLWQSQGNGKHATLATPAVRHLSKENNVDISLIQGTGKDGRVTKDDVHRFIQQRDSGAPLPPPQPSGSSGLPPYPSSPTPTAPGEQVETVVPLTKMQLNMFSAMTKSLKIPHFLYSDEVDFTQLCELRHRLNKVLAGASVPSGQDPEDRVSKLSYLPFIIKAMSLALQRFPVLNARVEVDTSTDTPSLVMRQQHNIGVAMDTPQGLIVPVVRDVGSLNVLAIARELDRLRGRALAGRLSPADISGGTVTVSNIGSIGGTYLSPVIVEREVAILGIGRMRTVPAFAKNGSDDKIVKKEVCNFSWSADHRVVDGATMARAAEVLRGIVEEPDVMIMHLR